MKVVCSTISTLYNKLTTYLNQPKWLHWPYKMKCVCIHTFKVHLTDIFLKRGRLLHHFTSLYRRWSAMLHRLDKKSESLLVASELPLLLLPLLLVLLLLLLLLLLLVLLLLLLLLLPPWAVIFCISWSL